MWFKCLFLGKQRENGYHSNQGKFRYQLERKNPESNKRKRKTQTCKTKLLENHLETTA